MKLQFLIPLIILLFLSMLGVERSYASDYTKSPEDQKVKIFFFYGAECPHCITKKHFFERLKQEYPQIEIHSFEVWHNEENAELFVAMSEAYGTEVFGVPTTFIGNFLPVIGFSCEATTGKQITYMVRCCIERGCINPIDMLDLPLIQRSIHKPQDGIVAIPLIGEFDPAAISLPLLTLILASADSINPCAFFVLFTLLSMLAHVKKRDRALLIGGIFVFFSGFIYFVFMALWLNFFLVAGEFEIITIIAGLIALTIATLNIKSFFFTKGISLAIPEKARFKLFDRMRNLLKATSLPSMVVGAAVLAMVVNAYELFCTLGFPMVFTRVLTLHELTPLEMYLYLVFYSVIYVIPMAVIVVTFSIAIKSKKFTEWHGQVLKLISGIMMLFLGSILLINPVLIANPFVSVGILIATMLISGAIISIAAAFKVPTPPRTYTHTSIHR
ncbi:hypothetical protein M1M97_00510 [Thermodesulfovibrionales bacterium]|nr:hypothetical protein [Thermodesulfovibrionales bacterium]